MPSPCPTTFWLPPLSFAASSAATGRQLIERVWDAAVSSLGDEDTAAEMGSSSSGGGTGSGDRSHKRRLLDTVLRIADFCFMIGELEESATTVDDSPSD